MTARTEDGAETDLELLLLPLAHTGHARIRALGVLAPTVAPYWLGAKPVTELTLGTLRHIGADAGQPHCAASGPGRRRQPDTARLRGL